MPEQRRLWPVLREHRRVATGLVHPGLAESSRQKVLRACWFRPGKAGSYRQAEVPVQPAEWLPQILLLVQRAVPAEFPGPVLRL
ncbi:MAG TPA: hypothetical protein DCX79_15715 [Planctomycetaceae bacterium]|nr:hypothetical protein [Planctomycetaceae bacterium]